MEEYKTSETMTCPTEIAEAILTLKGYCRQRDCDKCILWTKTGECMMMTDAPEDWRTEDIKV